MGTFDRELLLKQMHLDYQPNVLNPTRARRYATLGCSISNHPDNDPNQLLHVPMLSKRLEWPQGANSFQREASDAQANAAQL